VKIGEIRIRRRDDWYGWCPGCKIALRLPAGEYASFRTTDYQRFRRWAIRHLRRHEELEE
jgi:hypothetical protein